MAIESVNCTKCKNLTCLVGGKKQSDNCPVVLNSEIYNLARKAYEEPENKRIARNAGLVEALGYIEWPRLKDTIEFAKLMDYTKLGLAFCIGLLDETRKIQEIFENYGFTIHSILCKTGSFTKTEIGDIPAEYQMTSKTGYAIGFISCNPIAQAMLLNEIGTDFNIIVGLCVGHDTLFIKYSKAPVTVLIAKDRRLGHNPAAALSNFYYNKFFQKDNQKK